MNILHFDMNVPKQVTLASPQGTTIEGRYGNRVMFHLGNGQVMYVPPIVATKIETEGITTGEHIELCKTSIREGRRRLIEWQLKRVEAPTQLEQDLRASLENARKPTAAASTAEEIPPFAPIAKANGNGNHVAAPRNGTVPAPAATKLEHALKTAIAAARSAEMFGSELGYVVRFDSDAIKSMAITVLINMSGENRR